MDAGPITFASCREIHEADPTKQNGVYDLTPSSGPSYKAYCEMTDFDGGWTLVLKLDGNKPTFEYDKPIWTDTNAHAANKPDLDQQEAKLASYWSVPFTKILLGMIDGGTKRYKVLTMTGTSLHALISPGNEIKTTEGNGFWKGLLASGSIQTFCNWEGINANQVVRIGLVGDETPGCFSSDSAIGFGIKKGEGPACGNFADWLPDNGKKDTKTWGYVLVR